MAEGSIELNLLAIVHPMVHARLKGATDLFPSGLPTGGNKEMDVHTLFDECQADRHVPPACSLPSLRPQGIQTHRNTMQCIGVRA